MLQLVNSIDKITSVSTYIVFLLLLIAGIKSGVFKTKNTKNFDIESKNDSEANATAQQKLDSTADDTNKHRTYEESKLLEYYTQALNQSKTSFWFSLIFASLGFCIIASSPFLYKEGGGLDATVKLLSGTIVSSVSSLFFIQSKRAQQAMVTFFDKLRSDRLALEAKNISNEIQNPDLKDKLKTILVLNNAGLDTSSLLSDCKL
ncbi:hypothetical membrane protein [Solidesulfovibrio magneticus RS-1]|uniref:Hypothetical membrane protein n=2 Tax=Solidesulfovibrio TaxID=2910984 RepID=C4XTH0_SOLM1|nr:hypothetical membrane protein [Solidesulfovibrio magneticus RS-1]